MAKSDIEIAQEAKLENIENVAASLGIDKDEIVLQFTDGRTTHLTEMTDAEYAEMLAALEEAARPSHAELKRCDSGLHDDKEICFCGTGGTGAGVSRSL